MKTLLTGVGVCLFCIFSPLTSFATIINIPADQSSIQAGIDNAVNGDTVLVAEGTYYENIIFNGKLITVASRFILDQNPEHIFNTVIDGSQPTSLDTVSVVRIVDGENSLTQLIGFTITGGTATTWTDPHGFGVYREGGGILCEFSSPVIAYNYIVNNEAINLNGGMVSAGGGGIRAGDGNPQIYNNIIMHNRGRYGAGIVLNFADGKIKNNVIAYNTGGEDFAGSGIWKYQGGNALVENNTIIYNESVLMGGGVYVWSTTMTLKNNIIRGNIAPAVPQIRVAGASVDVTYCNVEDGYAGTGNIDVDPQFAGQYFYLKKTSPCIDMGNPSGSYNDPEHPDIAGTALWPSWGTTTNDMGAYGGLRSFPFERLSFYSDTTWGWVPLDVEFMGGTIFPVDSIRWDFGDGSNSDIAEPVHTYTSNGIFPVTFTAYTAIGQLDYTVSDQIVALADTIYSDTVNGQPGETIEFLLSGNNSVPLSSLKIPVEYGGTLPLSFDSISSVGCRTEYFELVNFSHFDSFNKRFTLLLKADNGGGSSPLPPGEGDIIRLYFSLSSGADEAQETSILLDGYTTNAPEFISSYINYAPATYDGLIGVEPCCTCIRGNIDGDELDEINISDILYFVEWSFNTPPGPAPVCDTEADVTANGEINIEDLLFMVAYMFELPPGPAPLPCATTP